MEKRYVTTNSLVREINKFTAILNDPEVHCEVTCSDNVTCTMTKVEISDIETIAKGSRVAIIFDNDEEFFGFYKNIDDSEIEIKPFVGKHRDVLSFGLPIDRISMIFAEIKN